MAAQIADVAVVGLGPAGRALAHRLLGAGLNVHALDPDPERSWWQTYAGWERQLPDWLDSSVIGARCGRPVIRAREVISLADEYIVLDNARLREQLSIAGARVTARAVTDAALSELPEPVVVDCRGSHPMGARDRGHANGWAQTAHGMFLPAGAAAPLLEGAPAVLMDWRPYDGSASWRQRPATFCYAVPLADGRVLAEETSLAAAPPMSQRELRRRLLTRLAHHGVTPTEDVGLEKVHIPLVPRPRASHPRMHLFGTAGEQLNPISGYSVLASLGHADDLVAAISSGARPAAPQAARPVRHAALAAMGHLSGDDTAELFNAFAKLSPAHRQAILDVDSSPARLLTAMGRQWWAMAARRRPALVLATARGQMGRT